ncbi:MAG: FKBP-type peptidyl-prolyl cis-trans isomerase [Candidatus Babeliales bacterium]|jgi:peptidylprolyl isomerase
MNAKKHFLLLSAICSLGLTSCTKDNTKTTKNKGLSMNIKQGDTLDLSTFTKSDTGIHHKITKVGEGKKPFSGETVKVHYTGWLLDGENKVGTKFDSSVDRGQHFEFPLGMGYVIKGWDISVSKMNIGEKRIVILPPHLGYGARGAGASIPGNATLIFEIELFGSK